jgi:microcystin-dependent protein
VLSTTTFDTTSPVYLEISVGGVVVLPRLQMLGTPYAAISGTSENLKPTNQPLITTGNLQASAATLTASGSNQPSLTTSSGIVVNAGQVTAPAFVGTLYGNVVGNTPGAPPIGAIILYAGANEPAGWIECDGRSMSQSGTTVASWGSFTTAPLFAAIGTVWGSGGAGLFNAPDFRGIFPRGWNHGKNSGLYDPDASTRVAQYASGATGDRVGTYETDQFRSHTHATTGFNGITGPSGVGNYLGMSSLTNSSGASGGNETRPMNASVMYIMRVQ